MSRWLLIDRPLDHYGQRISDTQRLIRPDIDRPTVPTWIWLSSLGKSWSLVVVCISTGYFRGFLEYGVTGRLYSGMAVS